MSIQVRHVTKRFAQFTALDDDTTWKLPERASRLTLHKAPKYAVGLRRPLTNST